MIAIIDYGMGNLRSVQKAFEAVGHQAIVTRDARAIGDASHVVLPGVGAFGDCMENLDRYGLIEPVRRAVQSGKPFLGICLGLQLLFTESEEFGRHPGLDLIPGKVRRFTSGSEEVPDRTMAHLKVPHMGWNDVRVTRTAPPLRGIESGAYLYFVHSYYVEPQDNGVACTMTDYGRSFVSSVWRDNVFACQFHPEKSQSLGLRIIRNFAEWEG
ncbi:MAG: imidazole glycerol phosphate synthase subunit HisH [Nitrospirota bacterium]|nr:imidazole glycerol phosphate synthase subunit HisH [Nitrospirota bacterium]MDE3034431.1 imidazole glycerol phosphate synthase subunit HisH [Nitrospirota bacterium]MDE3225355.1 imidazole glycerol phosphate synthase subunit HisH [Nitrospirota bacterium]MDE3243508.1 imidazole glycerol phosphate synthase subunit HisH [Nitrospirota bacterium]